MKFIKIQPAERPDMKLPYPFTLNELGAVERQDFWKGEPLRLVGFARIADRQQIDLQLKGFFKKPERSIGLYPVFANKDGEWNTYRDKIASAQYVTILPAKRAGKSLGLPVKKHLYHIQYQMEDTEPDTTVLRANSHDDAFDVLREKIKKEENISDKDIGELSILEIKEVKE